MRPKLSFILIALCFLVACSDQKQETSATAATTTSDEMERTSLPIKEPSRQAYTELDAAKVKAPTERFERKSTEGCT